ncbi:tRNA pseudouridine(38-40) synthase TruA [Pelotalea chapellei]|uniref:tRNA pseudouridine synthase A n=1 Tax=Pelotalea chapellei TaxID=44671 RepID=A0ABS5U568_9BACT|nr:tRNA pseudouridine(38-40) synthase TruA [Pelotalea chapellei]MBT1070797.1 tRNA pseudouridine(38-40) synthase TruA [Pelotalea chapellei]
MRKVRLTIEYEGTRYAGWQVQPNGLAIQQVMEEALMSLLGEQVRLRSSGRTDAGVHALGMVAVFSTTSHLPLRAFVDGTNRFLPPDIAVREATEASSDFNPIAHAVSKHYRYTIYNTFVRSPLRRFSSWHVKEPLDLAAMQTAASNFVGRHDFASFRASNCATKTTERRVDAVHVSRDGALVYIDVIGEGFLKNMVRVMAGTLVDVGRKRFAPEYIAWLLLNPDRKKAGVTAPACGLCLMEVSYGEKVDRLE